jgi:hypothetical protein
MAGWEVSGREGAIKFEIGGGDGVAVGHLFPGVGSGFRIGLRGFAAT